MLSSASGARLCSADSTPSLLPAPSLPSARPGQACPSVCLMCKPGGGCDGCAAGAVQDPADPDRCRRCADTLCYECGPTPATCIKCAEFVTYIDYTVPWEEDRPVYRDPATGKCTAVRRPRTRRRRRLPLSRGAAAASVPCLRLMWTLPNPFSHAVQAPPTRGLPEVRRGSGELHQMRCVGEAGVPLIDRQIPPPPAAARCRFLTAHLSALSPGPAALLQRKDMPW